MRLDAAYVQSLALMPRSYWAEVQVPGTDAPFSVSDGGVPVGGRGTAAAGRRGGRRLGSPGRPAVLAGAAAGAAPGGVLVL